MKASDLVRARDIFREQYQREFDHGLALLYMKNQNAQIIAWLEGRPPPNPSPLLRGAVSEALNRRYR